MSMKYLKVFYDWPETTEYLKPAQKGELIDALVRYARGEKGVEASLKGAALALFPSFKRQIDSDANAYVAQTERNRENGKKGGRPRKEPAETQEKPTETQENPLGFSETQEKARQRIKTKTKSKDKDEDKDKEYTQGTSFPSSLKKKIDNNYKHSSRARAAVAQLIVDQICEYALPPASNKNLYSQVLDALEQGLTAEQVYDCAVRSSSAGDFASQLWFENGMKWSVNDELG